jgi:hypothetical protein
MPKRPGEFIGTRDGDLAHVKRDGSMSPAHYTAEEKRRFHGMLQLALDRGNKPGAAAYRFKDKFGHWPHDRYVEPLKPNAEVIAWDRHCRIKFAKSMQKAQGDG